MTDPQDRVPWFDRLLGVGDLSAAGLNWKGRLIERASALARLPVARFDRWVQVNGRLEGLNWKGRAIERGLGLQQRLSPLRAFDRRVGIADKLHGLNWKGRAYERWIALAECRWLVAFAILNRAGFALHRLRRLLRRRRVRSVLQLSLDSHKPYMVSRALRAQGLKSDYFALNVSDKAGILNLGYDYALPPSQQTPRRRVIEAWYLWTVVARYDVVHSHFKSFLSADGWELPYLKRLGVVLIYHFRGCDVRYRSLNFKLHPELNCCAECDYPIGSCDTDSQRSLVAMTRRYGDDFLVTTPDLREFVPEAEHIPFMHPVDIDFDAIVPAPRQSSVFRVVTSSNHHGIDGTRFIRAAVATLRAEGRAIELIEVDHMAYRDALAIYKSADVYVGKLRMGYYNNANIETMMLGVPNMSYIRPEFQSIAPDCPIIVTTPDTVEERLRYYIDHRDELRAIGARGPAFIRAHHDPATIARQLIRRYESALARSEQAPAAGAATPMFVLRKPQPSGPKPHTTKP